MPYFLLYYQNCIQNNIYIKDLLRMKVLYKNKDVFIIQTLPNAIGLPLNLKNLNISANNLMTIPDSNGEILMLKNLNLSNNKQICQYII